MMQDHQSLDAWAESMAHHEGSVAEPESPVSDQPIDLSERRGEPRFTLLIRVAKLTSPEAEFLCVVRDASESGISVRLFHPLPAGLEFTLELPNGDRHALERIWESEGRAGFNFREAVALERITEARGGYAKRPLRLQFELPCQLVLGERRVPATIANLSQQGALINTQEHLSLAQRIKLEIDGVPKIAARVRWRRDGRCGLSFEDAFQFAELAALAFELQREAA